MTYTYITIPDAFVTRKGTLRERIRAKIGWTAGEYEMDRSFLQAYYTAVRGRLETRMLLGKRKRDKFDRD